MLTTQPWKLLLQSLGLLIVVQAQFSPDDGNPPVETDVQPLSGPRMGGPIWQPKIGDRIQVILDKRVVRLDPDAPLVPAQADIWDVDLFDTPKETIDILHSKGKRVMCYVSVGGSESWRPDFRSIPAKDFGDIMPKWKGERYLNLKSPSVWKFMQNRIQMAYEKGCDALDPDNVDPFNDDFARGGGFNLTEADSIDYLRKISVEARRYGMSMGMKNAESLLPNVTDFIQFAVNEECTTYSTDEDGCWQYEPFLKSGKPVFHFEYVNVDSTTDYPRIQSVYKDWQNLTSPDILSYYCFRNNFGFPWLPSKEVGALFSTVIKKIDLGGWAMYCDGSSAETPTEQTVGGPDRELDPGWRGKGQGSSSGRGSKGGRQPSVSAGMDAPTGPQTDGLNPNNPSLGNPNPGSPDAVGGQPVGMDAPTGPQNGGLNPNPPALSNPNLGTPNTVNGGPIGMDIPTGPQNSGLNPALPMPGNPSPPVPVNPAWGNPKQNAPNPPVQLPWNAPNPSSANPYSNPQTPVNPTWGNPNANNPDANAGGLSSPNAIDSNLGQPSTPNSPDPVNPTWAELNPGNPNPNPNIPRPGSPTFGDANAGNPNPGSAYANNNPNPGPSNPGLKRRRRRSAGSVRQ